MNNIHINKFEKAVKNWDYFVENKSINGTFLQTRNFLNYHEEGKFTDHSLIIYKGEEILAVVPACETYENGERVFFSFRKHFGGIIIRSGFNDIRHVNAITNKLETYLQEQSFNKVYLKIHQEYFVKRILHY